MNAEMFVPPADHPLNRHVAMIFRVRGSEGYRDSTILPMSTVEILVNLGDPLRVRTFCDHSTDTDFVATRVAGIQTRPLVSWPRGAVDLFGVILRAEGAAELVPVPMHLLTDASLDGSHVMRSFEGLREELGNTPAFADQVRMVTRWLLGVRRDRDRRSAAIRWACGMLHRASSEASVARAAAELAMSPRHLRRVFLEYVGVSPAAYIRLKRFADAIHLMRRSPRLIDVAYAARYFDQAHFARDFKAFAGMTPHEYRRTRGPAPGRIFRA